MLGDLALIAAALAARVAGISCSSVVVNAYLLILTTSAPMFHACATVPSTLLEVVPRPPFVYVVLAVVGILQTYAPAVPLLVGCTNHGGGFGSGPFNYMDTGGAGEYTCETAGENAAAYYATGEHPNLADC